MIGMNSNNGDSQEYVERVMPRRDATAVNRQGLGMDDTVCDSQSILKPIRKANTYVLGNDKIDIVRDAEEYADSVSEHLGAVLKTPLSVGVRRNRQLPIPDENAIKKKLERMVTGDLDREIL